MVVAGGGGGEQQLVVVTAGQHALLLQPLRLARQHDAARHGSELDAGAEHPSIEWRRNFSLLLGLERLLAEAGAEGISDDFVSVAPRGFEQGADWASLKSPENYIGYERSEGFAQSVIAPREKPPGFRTRRPAALRRRRSSVAPPR